MGESARPWDQQPDEPTESYARFLLYRNLGPGRTIQLAYNAYVSTFRNANHAATERKKTPLPIPGHWSDDSARHRWVDRANAWDVDTLATHGERLASLWVGILVLAAEKCAQRLADPRCRPKDFAQAISVIDKLAAYMTPDAIKSLQPAAGDHGKKPRPARAAVE